jgi:fatty acid desaturase
MHEAAHYRLFKNRFLNDTISDALLAFPIGVSTSVYRKYHFAHHRYVNTELDPDIQKVVGDEDWSWPKTQFECFKIFVRDLVGLNVWRAWYFMWFWSPWRGLSSAPGSPTLLRRERITLILLYATIAAVVTALHAWPAFLLLWVVPCFTVLAAIFRIRNLAEHYGVGGDHELNESRTVLPSWWERLLIAPCNVNHHLDHHLFPSVPWYNLPRLHRLLMQDAAYATRAHITPSYTGLRRGLLAELLTGRRGDRERRPVVATQA